MKQEKVILSFIMVLIGLVVAGLIFYFYQSSKTITPSKTVFQTVSPTPTQNSSFFLNIKDPKDESISDRRTIVVSGKTDPSATVAILTSSDQEIIKPSQQGDFSTTVTIDSGANLIKIQAFLPTGETLVAQRTVSYTTTQF